MRQSQRKTLEARRRAPQDTVQAGFAVDLGERAIAVVEEEPEAAVERYEYVGPAVVVHVGNGHAGAVAGDVQAGPLADVGEAAVGALAEQPVRGGGVRAVPSGP